MSISQGKHVRGSIAPESQVSLLARLAMQLAVWTGSSEHKWSVRVYTASTGALDCLEVEVSRPGKRGPSRD